ncbi:hypothetical protein PHLCEN_2v6364 [Hermanssonia centrifuga]|uniref:WD40 repeat-like protein n=1 Tax=Hermanssonia centrifuga TaxID=98765 RepID=A0A2R6NZQ5_9APHY|nr:hypothetical protein PHLCEN_2v6364 [Hermanssonia centrifuga]
MIPQRRFATLLDQARDYQQLRCLYHNAPMNSRTFSLYADHSCDKNAFPRVTTAILEIHTDEVWNLEWSHSGTYLATASKDKSAIIWRIGTEADPSIREYYAQHILRDHEWPVGCVAWSLDDSILLTAAENQIKMWNTRTGLCIRALEAHTDVVTALSWLPDGSGFISGGLDRKIILWDVDGKQRDTWGRTPIRVTDLAITPDFTKLVAVGMYDLPSPIPQSNAPSAEGVTPPAASGAAHANNSPPTEFRMIVYDLATKQLEASIRTEGELTSVKISHDSQCALVNRAPGDSNVLCEIQLWDLRTARTVRRYSGQKQSRHVIRSCFGGVDGNFILSGSEDGNVYVWHRDTGVLLETLPGHGIGSVNSVAWNPRNERLFASCSDDKTIRIWESPPGLPVSFAADVGDYGHEYELGGKGKGKGREHWGEVGLDGTSSYGTGGTSRSL